MSTPTIVFVTIGLTILVDLAFAGLVCIGWLLSDDYIRKQRSRG